MRRYRWIQDPFRRLKWVIAAFLLTCVVGSVYAGVRVNASGIRSTGVTATGVRTTATLEATFTGTMNGVKTYGVPVPVSSSTLGSLAKGAMRRALPAYGWYQVAKGLIDGAGWAIDELQQQVIVPGTKQDLDREGWCRLKHCASTPEGIRSYIASQYVGAQPPIVRWEFVQTSADAGLVNGYRADGVHQVMQSVGRILRPSNGWTGYTDVSTGSESRQVTDHELGQLLKQSPQVVNAILIDPETGAPIRTQELVDAMNDLRRQLEAANGLAPGTDVPPTDDPAKPEIRESEWPGFCDWATTVCEFMNWVKEDVPEGEKPEVPWEEEDPKQYEQKWTSGLGGGSCPAPVQITVSVGPGGTSVEFPVEPICRFVTLLRPVMIGLATLLAAFIIGGLRSTKDA